MNNKRRDFNLNHKSMHIRPALCDRITRIACGMICVLMLILFIGPLSYVMLSSVRWGGKTSLNGYRLLLSNEAVLRGALNSCVYSVVGTAVSLSVTVCTAYALSRRELKCRKFVYWMLMITNYFSGGMIAMFLLVKRLGMVNSMWALILPNCMGIYSTRVLMNRFSNSISQDIHSAASIDGAGHLRFLLQIGIPLMAPSIAVTAFSCFVGYWNSYMSARLYLTDEALYPLSVVLNNILMKNQAADILNTSSSASAVHATITAEYALIFLSSLPVMLIFCLMQRKIRHSELEGGVVM